jgi:DNA-binding GntR family transcriptional regulator
MVFEKISSKTLRHAVYTQVRESIISGILRPGQSISLRNIAEQFGVSISPVREAVWQLESEKILIVESNKSIRVNSLNSTEMEEALNIRLLIETHAAKLACERRNDQVLPKIKTMLRQLNGAIEKPKRYLDLNSKYHLAIYACAESPLLFDVINRIWARIVPYFFLYVSNPQDLRRTIEFHLAMYKALEARDAKRMEQAVKEDLETAARMIIPALTK